MFDGIKKAMVAKEAWETFTQNHPKFPLFMQAVMVNGIQEGAVIAISVTDPNGKVIDTNLRVTESDIELFEMLKDINK